MTTNEGPNPQTNDGTLRQPFQDSWIPTRQLNARTLQESRDSGALYRQAISDRDQANPTPCPAMRSTQAGSCPEHSHSNGIWKPSSRILPPLVLLINTSSQTCCVTTVYYSTMQQGLYTPILSLSSTSPKGLH